jgi:LPS-assembly lipoprotein
LSASGANGDVGRAGTGRGATCVGIKDWESSVTRRLTVVLVGCALLLSACGFQLRGEENFAFKRIFIAGSPNRAMAARLKRMIEGGSDTKVVLLQSQADAILTLSEARGQGVLSLNAEGAVEEYELDNTLNYRLTTVDGALLLQPGSITLNRSLTYSTQFSLAKASESDLLYADMENDTVDQLIRRLAVVHTLTPKPGEIPSVQQRAPLPTPPL